MSQCQRDMALLLQKFGHFVYHYSSCCLWFTEGSSGTSQIRSVLPLECLLESPAMHQSFSVYESMWKV